MPRKSEIHLNLDIYLHIIIRMRIINSYIKRYGDVAATICCIYPSAVSNWSVARSILSILKWCDHGRGAEQLSQHSTDTLQCRDAIHTLTTDIITTVSTLSDH